MMTRIAIVGSFAAFLVFSVVLVRGVNDEATAKDEIDLPALATQVAGLNGQVGYLYGASLPPKDPDAYWLGTLYTFDRDHYEFGLVCTITQVGYQYALRCGQADKAGLP